MADDLMMLNLVGDEPPRQADRPASRAPQQKQQKRSRERDYDGDYEADYADARHARPVHQAPARRSRLRIDQVGVAPGRQPALSKDAVTDIFGSTPLAARDSSGTTGASAAATFQSMGVPEKLVQFMAASMGVTAPTRVQLLTMPHMMGGRDVLVKSETGSGKTLAYLLPVVTLLARAEPRLSRGDGTRAVVLAPTRELCQQIFLTAQRLLTPIIWVVPGAIMGGENRQKEKARLRKGITVLCATPGRLLDHLRSTQAFLQAVANLQFLVFDEADRLLDMGFEEAVKEIVQLLGGAADGARRCTALLSATLPRSLERLTEVALHNPVRVALERGQQAGGGAAGMGDGVDTAETFQFPQQLSQSFVMVPCKLRLLAIVSVIRSWLRRGVHRAMLFFSSCEAVEFHHQLLSTLTVDGEQVLPCALHRLHGDLPAAERHSVFREFCRGESGMLLCTDVAARGLDFSGVGATVQVDVSAAGDYCHRVGRSARIGHEGEALLLVLPSELAYVDVLRGLGAPLTQRPLEQFLDVLVGGRKPGRAVLDDVMRHPAVGPFQRCVEGAVNSEPTLHALAERAFASHVRAYAALPSELKPICHVKKLHLGHVAAAFGLKDTPKDFSARSSRKRQRENERATKHSKKKGGQQRR